MSPFYDGETTMTVNVGKGSQGQLEIADSVSLVKDPGYLCTECVLPKLQQGS
jgi:hypothetical protein